MRCHSSHRLLQNQDSLKGNHSPDGWHLHFSSCDLDDLINIQICVDGVLIGIQLIRLIRFHAEQRIFILLSIDSNGGNSQFIQCTENTDRDISPRFATILRNLRIFAASIIATPPFPIVCLFYHTSFMNTNAFLSQMQEKFSVYQNHLSFFRGQS